MPGMGLTQTTRQTQGMVMSQKMIQSISILAMSALDLREYLYREAEKNPAIEIAEDETSAAFEKSLGFSKTAGNARLTAKKTAGTTAESDAFQVFLENRPAPAGTIQEHLLSQLNLLSLTETEVGLCKKIIGNLDTRGFQFEPPERLLDPAIPGETPEMLGKCLGLVRGLDPAGTACAGSAESLFVQAQIRSDAPPLALFILNGRLSVLENRTPARIRKKLEALRLLADEKDAVLAVGKITGKDIQEAVGYIRTLEPFPAQEFDRKEPGYIVPEVYVCKNTGEDDAPDSLRFTVTFANGSLPRLELAAEFANFVDSSASLRKADVRFAAGLIKDAKWIIETVEQREQAIVKTVQAIIEFQLPFFEQGPRFLRPLKMKNAAELTGVHEGTISRIVNGKYLQCDWGLFELRYFFSSQTGTVEGASRSKESVKQELQLIIHEHEDQRRHNPKIKKLSDETLTQKLEERGIKIARRTVAKYRLELQNK